MKPVAWSSWHSLGTHTRELSLRRTLTSGQSFRWRERHPSEWVGVLGRTAFALKENGDGVDFSYFHAEQKATFTEKEAKARLRDYFHLEKFELMTYVDKWGVSVSSENAEDHVNINKDFSSVARLLPGLRLLRQDPEECLFSFICSQNNNVKRITGMIDSFASGFGEAICEDNGQKLYTFPSIARIAKISEQELRDMGFGYRAKYIPKAAQEVLKREEKEADWLRGLRLKQRDVTVSELQELTGVGPKVADCISLFSLDKVDLVPVDTHVWQITERYMPSLRGKNLSAVLYKSIGSFWRERFGEWAGWAHTIMFAAELNNFKGEVESILGELPKKEKPKPKKKQKTREEKAPTNSKVASGNKKRKGVGDAESAVPAKGKKQRAKRKDGQ